MSIVVLYFFVAGLLIGGIGGVGITTIINKRQGKRELARWKDEELE